MNWPERVENSYFKKWLSTQSIPALISQKKGNLCCWLNSTFYTKGNFWLKWVIIFLDLFSLREKWPNSEFFWFVFSHIWSEYEDILRISPYSVRMRENTDQKNSEYGHFSGSVFHCLKWKILTSALTYRKNITCGFFKG